MLKTIIFKMLFFILLLITSLIIISTTGLAQENRRVFQGRVFQGEVGDESRPLRGVKVKLYGADADYTNLDFLIEEGTLIGSTYTDNRGWYGINAGEGFEFYSIVETDPPGYVSVGARKVSGTVQTNNWIQFSWPLEENLTGNKFWDKRPSSSQERGRPHIEAVVPSRGNRGQELTLTIRGNNFIPATIVNIPEIDVLNTQFINSNELRVTIAIHPNAPLGSRYVKVVNAEELEDVLEDGFIVQALQQPDLKISFTKWEIVEDGRVLLILVDIENIGNRGAPGTVVRAEEPDRDWFSENFPVPELRPNERKSVEIFLPIPDNQRGMSHAFILKVDPTGQIEESNKQNNVARTSRITLEGIIPPPPPPNNIPIKEITGAVIIILGLGSGYYFLRKASNEKKMKEAIKSRVKIVPKLNLESQQLELDIKIQPDFEIRLKPFSEPGQQEVEAKGNFVIDERRINE